MVTYTWADLTIPEASMLADLHGMSYDFERAQELAKQLMAERAAEKPNWSLSEPFSIAIAVMYSRPFQQGVRHSLDETDLAILAPAQREAHDYLWHYRNKHVAHSVNSFEENQPRANYCVERVKQEGITSISCGSGRLTGMSVFDLENVIELTTVFGAHIDSLIAQEQDRLLAIVREISLEIVLAGGRKAFSGGNRSAVSKDRKKPAVRKAVGVPLRPAVQSVLIKGGLDGCHYAIVVRPPYHLLMVRPRARRRIPNRKSNLGPGHVAFKKYGRLGFGFFIS